METSLRQIMQQIEMVNHMENTVQAMPAWIEYALRSILKWLNSRFASDQSPKSRKSTKQNDRTRNNCSIKGANVDSSVKLESSWNYQSKRETIRETDPFEHTRLPDPLYRGIVDRYHYLE